MHRIHVRTGVVDFPYLTAEHMEPTHDIFVIPTGPGEEVVELDMLDIGFAPDEVDPETGARLWKRRKKRWRFRCVSVEPTDDPRDSDIIIDAQIVGDADPDTLAARVKGMLGRPGER